jgi:hypothetical protein
MAISARLEGEDVVVEAAPLAPAAPTAPAA